jgi:hypothetical protein
MARSPAREARALPDQTLAERLIKNFEQEIGVLFVHAHVCTS